MNARFLTLLVALVAAVPFGASAGQCVPALKGGWVRLGPVAMPVMAGFGRLENPCPRPVVVVSVRSAAFGEVSIHESRVVAGVNRMRELSELPVAPKSSATLAPGGLHLMLMDPTSTLKPGSHVAIDFTLKDGRHVLGDFEVKAP